MKNRVGSVYRPKAIVVGKLTLRVLLFSMLLIYPLFAGLTDFKTIEKANKAYEEKEYAKSASLLNSLDAKSPQKEYDIGNALYKDKKYDEAIEAYEKAEGVDEATRLHNIGNSLFQKKELDKAIEAYENALKLKEDEDTKFNLDLAKKQKQKEEEQKKKDQKDKDKKDDKKKDDKKNDDKKDNKDQKDQDKKDQEKKNKDDKKQEEKQKKDKKDKDGKKKDEKKKEGDKDKNDSKKEKDKKPKDEKGDKESGKPQEPKKMSKEEKLKEQELKRLMKKMQKGKTPTMMYQMGEGKKGQRSEDAKPW